MTSAATAGATVTQPPVQVDRRARFEILGAVMLVNGPDRAPFSDAEERTATEIGRRAGLAVDNSRLYGRQRGMSNLAPHDLRRTFAKLAHRGHAALEQIQLSLGHASVTTTERYLGVRQDLTDAPCDHLGLRLEFRS